MICTVSLSPALVEGVNLMNAWKIGVLMFYHPIRACAVIKRRRQNFSPWPVLILIISALVAKIISVYTVNFTVAHISPQDANIVYEAGILLIPFLTWVVCSYAVQSVLSGETLITENLTACSYCLIPYILIKIVCIPLSKLLSTSESGFFELLESLAVIWVIVLLVLALKCLNDYSLGKSLFVGFLSLGLMIILAIAVILIVALISQVVYFLIELLKELRL